MAIPAFPKIFSLGDKNIHDLLQLPVEVTEKIDGSQFAFGNIDGEFLARSKGTMISPSQIPTLFYKSYQHAEQMFLLGRLPENVVFYGEAVSSRNHNTLCYDKVPTNNIVLFGAIELPKMTPLPYDTIAKYASTLDVDVTPLLFKGVVENMPHIEALLDKESYLGGPKIEGVVVRRLLETPMEVYGSVSYIMAGKYVSEAFKEKHSRNPEFTSSKHKVEEILENFRTEARWDKAVQYYAEQDKLEGSPKDIGTLIKRVQDDVLEEEADNVKELLWKYFKPHLVKSCVKGLPEWYKKKLLSEQF